MSKGRRRQRPNARAIIFGSPEKRSVGQRSGDVQPVGGGSGEERSMETWSMAFDEEIRGSWSL